MTISRRDFLKLTAGTVPSLAMFPLGIEGWLPRSAYFSPLSQPSDGDVLVAVFLRGAMDGLNALVPFGDGDYYDQRPGIAIAQPKSGDSKSVIRLTDYFGLHPALQPLKEIWDAGHLALIPACGSPDPTHSHFDAMDYMERGTPGQKQIASGWLARHLANADWQNQSALRAVAFGAMLPSSLRGPVPATALQSISTFHLGGKKKNPLVEQFQTDLSMLYQLDATPADLAQASALTFATSEQLGAIAASAPANEQQSQSRFTQSLLQVAQLIKADVGLEVAAVDLGGWDTHVQEGGAEGQMANLLAELAGGLQSFYQALGVDIGRVMLVAMSEFGRRVQENGGGGTDHGHGNVMWVMGGGINGGRIYGQWPGLSPENLYGPGDVPVTTDFRTVLAELVQKRLKNPHLDVVFPDFSPEFLGLAN